MVKSISWIFNCSFVSRPVKGMMLYSISFTQDGFSILS
uniref:Uncharacterized protein n=1 Tax=Geladintestivirus 4 TaxID=3233136 RepID=A0AAU8MIM6_9CAUD